MLYRVVGRLFYGLSVGSVALYAATLLRASGAKKTGGILGWGATADSRGERLGIFVGLWAPTLAIAGKIFEDKGREQAAMQAGLTTGRFTTGQGTTGYKTPSPQDSIDRADQMANTTR